MLLSADLELSFRYYDGRQWHERWPADARGALCAVEITARVRSGVSTCERRLVVALPAMRATALAVAAERTAVEGAVG
jgi:hypothetical protein